MADIILVQNEPRGPSCLVQTPVITGDQSVNLPDVQQLRSTPDKNIVIKIIRLIPATVASFPATVGGGGPNAPIAELKKIYLVIYCEGWEKGYLIPIITLIDTRSNDAATIPNRYGSTRFSDWRNVDWSKSRLQFANGQAAAGGPYTVILEVEYEQFNAQNQIIKVGG